MSNRRFEMFEYRAVLVRMRQGDTDRSIARSGLMGRTKVRDFRVLARLHGWLDPEGPLPDEEEIAVTLSGRRAASPGSTVEPYRAQVVEWAKEGVRSTSIHKALVRLHGYTGSYSSVNRFVRGLGLSTPEPTVHLDFSSGDAAQVDFGSGPVIVDPETGEQFRTWFFVMVLAFSRHQYAVLVRDQRVETWLECHRQAFEWFGGVPARVIIDNAKCAIVKACRHDPVVQRSYAECAEGYGFRIDPCPPRDPKKKGRVEAAVKYIKNGFVPTREFRGLADANRQLHEWVLGEAGNRIHGSTRERPLGLFELEKPDLRPLPDQPPELAVWANPKVHQDGHVHYLKCLYSVPHRFTGKDLWLRATARTVSIYDGHELVATHIRAFRPTTRVTNDDHLPPNAIAYKSRPAEWCLEESRDVGEACHEVVRILFDDHVMVNLRAVQGLIRLADKYGPGRLEAACRRALDYHNPRYRTVKTILEKGLDAQPSEESAFDALADCYTGKGRYSRDTGKLLKH